MNEEKATRITSYLKNSPSFLFGVFDHAKLSRNQSRDRRDDATKIGGEYYGLWQGDIYTEIQGILKYNGKEAKKIFPWDAQHKVPYATATARLLDQKLYGISNILKELILPYQAKIFKDHQHEIAFLKKCWDDGDWPRSVTKEHYEKWSPNKIEMVHFYQTNFVEFYIKKEEPLSWAKGWSLWAFIYWGELNPDPDPELKIEYYMNR